MAMALECVRGGWGPWDITPRYSMLINSIAGSCMNPSHSPWLHVTSAELALRDAFTSGHEASCCTRAEAEQQPNVVSQLSNRCLGMGQDNTLLTSIKPLINH